MWAAETLANPNITATAKVTLMALANRKNARTGQCNPSLETISEWAGQSKRTVQNNVAELIAAGLLLKEIHIAPNGRTLGVSYSFPIPNDDDVANIATPEVVNSATTEVVNSATPEVVNFAMGGWQDLLGGVAKNVKEGSKVCHQNMEYKLGNLNNIKTNKKEGRTQSRASSSEGFDEFWNAYPRKVKKGVAEKAWGKAIKLASPETIMAALKNYRWSEDRQFIPHPASWLNGKCWLDEQDPKPGSPADFDAFLAETQRRRQRTINDLKEAFQCHLELGFEVFTDQIAKADELGLEVPPEVRAAAIPTPKYDRV